MAIYYFKSDWSSATVEAASDLAAVAEAHRFANRIGYEVVVFTDSDSLLARIAPDAAYCISESGPYACSCPGCLAEYAAEQAAECAAEARNERALYGDS